jgi:hypothetical protein
MGHYLLYSVPLNMFPSTQKYKFCLHKEVNPHILPFYHCQYIRRVPMHILQVIHSRYILYEQFILLNKVYYMQYFGKSHPIICKNTAHQQGHVTKQGTRECQIWSQSPMWTKCKKKNHRGYIFYRNFHYYM